MFFLGQAPAQHSRVTENCYAHCPPKHSCNHFRPINLCNIVYKIIFKIFSNGMRSILEQVIKPIESVIIPHRAIYDNILVAREIGINFAVVKGKKAA